MRLEGDGVGEGFGSHVGRSLRVQHFWSHVKEHKRELLYEPVPRHLGAAVRLDKVQVVREASKRFPSLAPERDARSSYVQRGKEATQRQPDRGKGSLHRFDDRLRLQAIRNLSDAMLNACCAPSYLCLHLSDTMLNGAGHPSDAILHAGSPPGHLCLHLISDAGSLHSHLCLHTLNCIGDEGRRVSPLFGGNSEFRSEVSHRAKGLTSHFLIRVLRDIGEMVSWLLHALPLHLDARVGWVEKNSRT